MINLLVERQVVMMAIWIDNSVSVVAGGFQTIKHQCLLVAWSNKLVITISLDDSASAAESSHAELEHRC